MPLSKKKYFIDPLFVQTPDPKTRKFITVLIGEKKDQLVIEGNNPYPQIQDIFGQMSLHKIDKKRRIQLTKVEDNPRSVSMNGQGKGETSNTVSAEPSTSENVQNEPSASSSQNSTKKLAEKHARKIKSLQEALNNCKKEIDRLEAAEVDFVSTLQIALYLISVKVLVGPFDSLLYLHYSLYFPLHFQR